MASQRSSDAASGISGDEHQFEWAETTKYLLENYALPRRTAMSADELRAVAQENYQIVQRGAYLNLSTGQECKVFIGPDWPNTTHVLQSGGQRLRPRFKTTRICVANVDTASAMRALWSAGVGTDAAVALNFANAHHPGGGYLNGAQAQEEDLCRLMPHLYTSLRSLRYPLPADRAHYTHTLLCRESNSYQLADPVRVAIISAAMPNLKADARLRHDCLAWERTATQRIRTVLCAAVQEKHTYLVLGAFGCGAFRNPPEHVAKLFARVLQSREFKGEFEQIIFAVLDPKTSDSGNFQIFAKVAREMCSSEASVSNAPQGR
eukprot:2742961-Pleurochrysis_carterae.AAC.3